MRTNAIIRIILFSLVIVLLLAILVVGIGFDQFMFRGTGTVANEASVSAADVSDLHINWAAGSITIQTGETDQITFQETGEITEKTAMVYSLTGSTLSIDFAKSSHVIGFGNLPSKDLIITVPADWLCRELELDAASVNVNVIGLTVESVDLDGAAMKFRFDGSIYALDCDGASCEINVVTATNPHSIDIDGASCELALTLPADCGFLVQMDGLGCSFESNADYQTSDGSYMYGDRYCKVNADGLSCQVDIRNNT